MYHLLLCPQADCRIICSIDFGQQIDRYVIYNLSEEFLPGPNFCAPRERSTSDKTGFGVGLECTYFTQNVAGGDTQILK